MNAMEKNTVNETLIGRRLVPSKKSSTDITPDEVASTAQRIGYAAVRVEQPGNFYTCDFQENRLRVLVDEAGTITDTMQG
jgi:signal recognition particle subunit SEC65